jgi:predicted transcriptional regulator
VAQNDAIKRVLVLDGSFEGPELARVLKALASPNRLRMLRYLWNKVATVSDIATNLELPASTVGLHVETLEEAGLIRTELEPASRGLQKVCIRMYDKVEVDLPTYDLPLEQVLEIEMPIGAFVNCQAIPTCGLLSENGIIGLLDDPASFYEPSHANAQLIWFKQGFLEYRFPNRLPAGVQPENLRLSMEICSEAPHYNLNWPSDITLWINDVEVGTWTSPADFGGEHGRLTPEWWPPRNTQYGLLKVWHINENRSEVDGITLSKVTINDLKLSTLPFISVRIGVKADAVHVGGLNLFGSHFGNYPQDLILRIGYRDLDQRQFVAD